MGGFSYATPEPGPGYATPKDPASDAKSEAEDAKTADADAPVEASAPPSEDKTPAPAALADSTPEMKPAA